MFTRAWLTSLPDLDTVDEDTAIEQQLQAEVLNNEHQAAEYVDAARRTSANSGMSGTTAKTSFSQEEIEELDPDIMVGALPSLATVTDELAKLLVPADPKSRAAVRKEIRSAGSKHNKLYNYHTAATNVPKSGFGSTEYIQPSIVLRALLGVQNMRDVPDGLWRPESIIYKANLTQMLRSTLITLSDSAGVTVDGYNAIESLDVSFASAIAGPGFRHNAFQLCLSILTQLSIIRVAGWHMDPNFNPERVITDTFYTPDQDGDLVFKHANVLHMMTLPQEDMSLYIESIKQLAHLLIAVFAQGSTIEFVLGALRARHPWEGFVEHVTQYYLERKRELDEQIAAAGGVDQIMLGLSEEVERRKGEREAAEKRRSFSKPDATPRKDFGKGGIRTLKAREKQLAANPSPAPAAAPVAQMTQPAAIQPDLAAAPMGDDGWVTLDDNGDVGQPAQSAAQSTARSTLAALSSFQDQQREIAAKGKGRSFVDRQEGAQRVTFDDGQLTQYTVPGEGAEFQYPASSAPAQGPYYQSTQNGPPKRGYADMDGPDDFDPTQDQGFEVDTRDTAAADQRRRELPPPRDPPARFSGLASGSVPPGASGISGYEATPSPSKKRRKNPGATIPPPPLPFDPEVDIEIPREQRMQRAKVAARHSTIVASQNKPAQVRTPWTDKEENALIELIEEEGGEGISYSKLKTFDEARGQKLRRRTAEDLRFKARNMKETFLK